MSRVFDIPWKEGSNTMCVVFDVPWVVGENTIGMGFDIPWLGTSLYHRKGSKYHW